VGWARDFALVVGAILLLFGALLALGVPIAWDIAFGIAYCLDSYPPCGDRT
jgi:hypothetical protein